MPDTRFVVQPDRISIIGETIDRLITADIAQRDVVTELYSEPPRVFRRVLYVSPATMAGAS